MSQKSLGSLAYISKQDQCLLQGNMLLGVNELIVEALEQIATKEGHLARMDGGSSSGYFIMNRISAHWFRISWEAE
ncbi:hypothetical protein Tco_0746451 [Tanacetum coccineum]